MTSEKKVLPQIKLYKANDDLSQRWFIYWYEGKKRIKKYKGINDYNSIQERTEAANKLIEHWQAELSSKKEGIPDTPYFNQYKSIMAFFERKKLTWRLSSAQDNNSRLKIFLKWNDGHEITKQRISDYIDFLRKSRRKPNTVHNHYLLLRNVLGHSLGLHLFEGLLVKSVPSTPARYFSKGQISFLSKNLSEIDPELWLSVQFIYYCFIRPGELRQLRVSDILLEEGKICIPAEISKNKKTQYVIIPQAFKDVLKDLIMNRNPSAFIVGGDFQMVGKNWLKNRHQKYLKQLHFDTKHYKLYSWKHTGAVAAVKSGIHIKQLQLQLRHHSLDQVNAYLRQMGIFEMQDFSTKMPKI